MSRLIFCTAITLALTACSPPASQAPQTNAPQQQAAAAPLTATGAAVSVSPDADAQEALQTAASVVQLDPLTHQGDLSVKLFGAAGGDPAMNGLYTHIAFFQGPAEGWRVFRIGDVLEYRVLSESAGRVDLEIQESVMNEASGEISSRTRRIIVGWTVGADGAAPSAITVTPAS